MLRSSKSENAPRSSRESDLGSTPHTYIFSRARTNRSDLFIYPSSGNRKPDPHGHGYECTRTRLLPPGSLFLSYLFELFTRKFLWVHVNGGGGMRASEGMGLNKRIIQRSADQLALRVSEPRDPTFWRIQALEDVSHPWQLQ